ncbi:MAG: flagellar basal body-associated FliL family protein [Paracoccaceae bacterium]
MIGKLIPILLILIGVGGGIGAGLMLKPAPEAPLLAANPCGELPAHGEDAPGAMAEEGHGDDHGAEGEATHEYVKLNNQFVVPVVGDDKVESLVVMSLSVEVATGAQEEVYKREPKLRDAFLQVLFDHANMGGFRGAFTNSNNMDVLRRALRETARKTVGDLISDVLIVDINRQDV